MQKAFQNETFLCRVFAVEGRTCPGHKWCSNVDKVVVVIQFEAVAAIGVVSAPEALLVKVISSLKFHDSHSVYRGSAVCFKWRVQIIIL